MKALVVFSGGQDSTTCLFAAMKEFGRDQVAAISIDYGQRHRRELDASEAIASAQSIPREVITLGAIMAGTSPLTNDGEKLEQYKDHASLPGGLEKTFVPARNLLFMVLAANRAYVAGCDTIVMGLSQEDYGGYPDCREGFIHAMEATLKEGLERDMKFWTPLLHMTKADSVKYALTMPGCYAALGFSHTSYDGAYPPTGHDHATLLRAKGFEEAGLPDPLVARAHFENLMPLPASANYQNYAPMLDEIFDLHGGSYEKLAELEKRLRDGVDA